MYEKYGNSLFLRENSTHTLFTKHTCFMHDANSLISISILTSNSWSPHILVWWNASQFLLFGKWLQDTGWQERVISWNSGQMDTLGKEWPYQRVVGAILEEGRKVSVKGYSSTEKYKGTVLPACVVFRPAPSLHKLLAEHLPTFHLGKSQLGFVWGALASYLCTALHSVQLRNQAVLQLFSCMMAYCT